MIKNFLLIILCTLPLTGCAQSIGLLHGIDATYKGWQGDAYLIQVGGMNVMIDAGWPTGLVPHNTITYLKRNDIKRIHHFYVSHPHIDHFGGLSNIYKAGIKVDKVYAEIPPVAVNDCCITTRFFNGMIASVRKNSTLHNPRTGDLLNLPNGSRIETIYRHDDLNGDYNDRSLVLKWYIGNTTVLFTGDLNRIGGDIVTKGNFNLRADILKGPHGGTEGFANDTFFDKVNPQIVLLAGPESRFCKPKGDRFRAWAKRNKTPYWITGTDGNTVIDFKTSSFQVSHAHAAKGCKHSYWGNGTYKPRSTSIIPIINLLLSKVKAHSLFPG